MCLSPRSIPNPFYGLADKGLNYYHDTLNTHILVPCGHCSQCIACRQSSWLQRIQMESLRSICFMMTLTYNNESLVYTQDPEYSIAYPLYKDVQDMLKRLRASGMHLRYLVTSEYGKKTHRPHYHGLIFLPKSVIPYKPTDNQYMPAIRALEHRLFQTFLHSWTRNGKPLCTYTYDNKTRRRNYDLHYVEPIPSHDNDTSFYVTKYITKYDDRTWKLLSKIALDPNLEPDTSASLISEIKPRCCASKDLGSYKEPLISQYIANCISRNYEAPTFFDLHTGKPMPLCRYYKKHLLTPEWAEQHQLTLPPEFYHISNTRIIEDNPYAQFLEFCNLNKDNMKLQLMRSRILSHLSSE